MQVNLSPGDDFVVIITNAHNQNKKRRNLGGEKIKRRGRGKERKEERGRGRGQGRHVSQRF
jgi:hypothetical protein